jgi:hypothetical protein
LTSWCRSKSWSRTRAIRTSIRNRRSRSGEGDRPPGLAIAGGGVDAVGFIVAGHGRYEAAKVLGLSAVPVDYQDFATEADEWAHLVADNRLAELAEADESALKGLLAELKAGDFDLDLAGFDAVRARGTAGRSTATGSAGRVPRSR